MTINIFRGDYGFLSNFWPCKLTYKGLEFKNAEAAYQAQKNKILADKFCNLTGGEAKKLGRTMLMTEDFVSNKVIIMEEIVRAKFEQNKDLARLLLKTDDHELVEGNYWNDKFWGVCLNTQKGKNHLGKILMKIREELKNKEK